MPRVAGAIAVGLGVGLWLLADGGPRLEAPLDVLLLGAAGAAWLFAAAVFAGLREHAGATEGGGKAGHGLAEPVAVPGEAGLRTVCGRARGCRS